MVSIRPLRASGVAIVKVYRQIGYFERDWFVEAALGESLCADDKVAQHAARPAQPKLTTRLQAALKYGEALHMLEGCGEAGAQIALKCFNNRAACACQLQLYTQVGRKRQDYTLTRGRGHGFSLG